VNHHSQGICVVHSKPALPGVVTPLASILLPSFGTVVLAVTLLQVLFLAQGSQGLFRDSDTGWHIRNGESVLDTRSVPRNDYFSFTRNGAQWFSWEWLSDALFAGAYRAAGFSGVALLTAIAIAMAIWGSARLALSMQGNLFFTAGATVLLLGTTSIHWLARSHVFSWLLALRFVAVAEYSRVGERHSSKALWLLPLASALWANMHGSFLLGPMILLVYAIGEWLESKSGLRFTVSSLACLLSTFVNPYGWRLHEHVFLYLQNQYLMDHISEFRSFSFHAAGGAYVELFLLVAVIGALAMVRQRAYAAAILTAGLLHLSLYSARHLPTAAIVILPLAIAALTQEAEGWPRLRAMLDYSRRISALDQRVFGTVPMMLVLIATVSGLIALSKNGHIGFSAEKFPVRAVDFLEQNGLGDRVFAKDQWGGYLIYRLNGQGRVFIDGRSDFYGQDMLESYAQVIEIRPAWSTVLRQYDVRTVLTAPDSALTSVLESSRSWKRVYTDSVAVIFEKVS